MKEKLKKIMITTLCSMTAGTAIGCANGNTKIAQKINNGVNDFVASINKLDFVDTNSTSNIGKIVSAANERNVFNTLAKNTNIENTITTPSERTDNFKLYVLSSTPYISLTSNDNEINLSMQFSTEKIETTSDDINENINKLILKRAILMIYVNEIYNGNVNLTEENRKAINAYVNVIKENASFLNGNRGMVKNQLGLASNLIEQDTNNDIVNYYIIKSGEALEIRSNKIDSTLSAIESIISILEQNLTESSCYYQNTLTTTYNNMLSNMSSNTESTNENTELAKTIAESINMVNDKTENNSSEATTQNTTRITTNDYKNRLNNNLQNKQNNNIIAENNLTTLEEKTQNDAKISENQPNNGVLNGNLNNLTPTQRAKIRRQERLNRQRNQQNPNQINTTNNTQNNTTNYIAPNSQNRKTTSQIEAQNNKTTNSLNTNTGRQNTLNPNYAHNKAVRVPYQSTNQINHNF